MAGPGPVAELLQGAGPALLPVSGVEIQVGFCGRVDGGHGWPPGEVDDAIPPLSAVPPGYRAGVSRPERNPAAECVPRMESLMTPQASGSGGAGVRRATAMSVEGAGTANNVMGAPGAR